MACTYVGFVLLAVACFLKLQGAPTNENYDQKLDPFLVRNLLSTDLEDGMGEWFDFSSGDVNWFIEAFDSPMESPGPQPSTGSKYLRVVRRDPESSGTAILRSPTFTAYPGDEVTFRFWIRSRHLQTNNLEVYWVNGTREERLLSLSEFSSPSNFQWRVATARIPISTVLDTKIVFYGYCGYNEEDSLALDDIRVESSSHTTTSVVPTTTTPSATIAPWCPQNLGGVVFAPCFKINTGCYCFYQGRHNREDADNICRKNGMALVSLETREEDAAVDNFIRNNSDYLSVDNYHTSGRYNSSVGSWVWGSGAKFNYTNWGSSQPSNNGTCVYFFGLSYLPTFGWAVTSCQSTYYAFICEK